MRVTQAEAKIKAARDMEAPPIKRYLDCKVLHDGCKGKIVILEGYLTKLAELATIAPEEDDADIVEVRLGQLDHFQEMVTMANTRINLISTSLKEL